MFSFNKKKEVPKVEALVETKEEVKDMSLKVKVKKVLENAVMPLRGSDAAAGYDLTAATKKVRLELTGPIFEYDTGLAFEIPSGYVGLIFPRSSISTKTSLSLGNCVGVIDSDYRGTIKFQFRNLNPAIAKPYEVGDRIGQLIIMPYPEVKFEEVSELGDTARGEGGFGSSGK